MAIISHYGFKINKKISDAINLIEPKLYMKNNHWMVPYKLIPFVGHTSKMAATTEQI
jgi:hypothetical protein